MWNRLLIWLGIREDIVSHVSRGDVRDDLLIVDEAGEVNEEQWKAPVRKKPKQMKSRSRKK